MFKSLNIYRVGSFCQPVEAQLPSLKAAVKVARGKTVRRIDRFTQLALLGVSDCVSDIALDKNTGLYLLSTYGSLNNSADVLTAMFKQNSIPSPLQFVNTVSNAACFHLAQQLDLQANNQFIARDDFSLEAGLKFAELDIRLGSVDAALVGLVSEVGLPLSTHRDRLAVAADAALGEASLWFLLANDIEGQLPLATIESVAEPITFEGIVQDLEGYLESEEQVDFIFNSQVPATVISDLESEYSIQALRLSPGMPSHDFCASQNIVQWLTLESSADRLLYLDMNARGQWSLTNIAKNVL